MTIQISVRLPDDVVSFVDEQIATGAARSRADFVCHVIERERRRLAAERDAASYAESGEDRELDGLAEYASRLPNPELD